MEVINLSSNPKDYIKINSQIEHESSKLSQERLPYNYLCGVLANLLLEIEVGAREFSDQDLREKKEEIISSLVSYDEICRLISELKVFDEQHLL